MNLLEKKNEIKKNERNLQALNYFLLEFNQDAKGFVLAFNEIEERLKDRLSQKDTEDHFLDLFYFYDVLSITNDKLVLYEYGLTGDKSIYPNFQALENLWNHYSAGNSSKIMLPGYVWKTINNLGMNSLSRVIVERVAIQLALRAKSKTISRMALSAASRSTIKRASQRAAAKILKTTTIRGSVITASFFPIEIIANALMAKFKSGFLEGELRIGILELDYFQKLSPRI